VYELMTFALARSAAKSRSARFAILRRPAKSFSSRTDVILSIVASLCASSRSSQSGTRCAFLGQSVAVKSLQTNKTSSQSPDSSSISVTVTAGWKSKPLRHTSASTHLWILFAAF